jgi:hypothetical protein
VLASVGSIGDAYDNALAESFVDSFKTELADRVWRTRSQLELAVAYYIGWFNHTRPRKPRRPAAGRVGGPRSASSGRPQADEGPTINGRPLRCPVASEILIS